MATPVYSTVIDQINTYIIANGNNEITANVLNPILTILADFTNNNIGNLDDLTTTEKDTVVASINSLKDDFDDLVNNGVQLHTGYDDPNVTPPASYNYADFYMQLDSGDDTPIYLWQWNGIEWVNSNYIPDPFPDQDNVTTNLTITLAGIGATDWSDDVIGKLAVYIAANSITVSAVQIYAFIVTDNSNTKIRQVYRLLNRGKGSLDDLVSSELYLETAENSTGVLPPAGTTGQVLAKVSDDDFDVEWVDQTGGTTPDATDTVKGKMKLFGVLGSATDGTISQDALTANFALKQNISITVDKISGTKTLSNADNGKVFILTANCTVTIPNGLIAGFNATFRTMASATYSQSLGGSVTLIGNVGSTMGEKLSFTLVNTDTTNEYLITGDL